MAIFEKRPSSTSKAAAKVVAPEFSDTSAVFPPGSRVRVKSNGAPAVIVGPGQKAFKGLVKIRYPDHSTFHVEIDQLERPNMAVRLALGLSIVSLVALHRFRWLGPWLWRFRWRLLLAAWLLAWRLRVKPPRRSKAPKPKPSRLLKPCEHIYPAVRDFCSFYAVQLPPLAYRSSDPLHLYLASPQLLALRVPCQLRHSDCGLPLLRRADRRWGCDLRPTTAAAQLLPFGARRLSVGSQLLAQLLRQRVVLETCDLEPGGVILDGALPALLSVSESVSFLSLEDDMAKGLVAQRFLHRSFL